MSMSVAELGEPVSEIVREGEGSFATNASITEAINEPYGDFF